MVVFSSFCILVERYCSQDLLETPGCPWCPWVPPGCLLAASRVPPWCLLGASWVSPGCSLGAQMSPRCFPDVSQMLSNQFNSNKIKSNQIKSNQVKPNQIKSNLFNFNQIKSNQFNSRQFNSNPLLQLKHLFGLFRLSHIYLYAYYLLYTHTTCFIRTIII